MEFDAVGMGSVVEEAQVISAGSVLSNSTARVEEDAASRGDEGIRSTQGECGVS